MSIKKRGAIYSVVALMLCIAVYLNANYTGSLGGKKDETANAETEGSGSIGQSVLVDSTDPEQSNTDISLDSPQASELTGNDELMAQLEDVSDEYFATARLLRQRARDEAVGILNTTAENVNATDDARLVASMDIQTLADNALMESRIESLVTAKGYKECIVFVSSSGINVIVSKTDEGLTPAAVAKIKDIVISESNVTADKIKISETSAS